MEGTQGQHICTTGAGSFWGSPWGVPSEGLPQGEGQEHTVGSGLLRGLLATCQVAGQLGLQKPGDTLRQRRAGLAPRSRGHTLWWVVA